MCQVTELDVTTGKAHPDEMGFYCVMATDDDGIAYGCTVSKFLARCDPERALAIAKENSFGEYPYLHDRLKIAGEW